MCVRIRASVYVPRSRSIWESAGDIIVRYPYLSLRPHIPMNDPPLERRPLYGIEGVRLRRLFNYTTSGGLEADSSLRGSEFSGGVPEFVSSLSSILCFRHLPWVQGVPPVSSVSLEGF